MAHLPTSVATKLVEQAGIVSRPQLLSGGLTRTNIATLRRTGVLVDVFRGVYRTPLTPFDERARSVAVCLADPRLTIAGPTAGRHWGFRRVGRDRRVHVIAPPASHPITEPWIVPYRTAAIHADDVITLADGRRVTTRSRTALDLTRLLDPSDALSVIEQAAHDGRLGSDALRRVAVDWRSSQRHWLDDFLDIVDARLDGGAAESHHEARLGDALQGAGVTGLVRQFAIDLPGYGPARFDLAIPALRWAIEVDVFPTHFGRNGAQRDARRDAGATAAGWATTRVGRSAVEQDADGTVAWLASEFRRRTDELRTA